MPFVPVKTPGQQGVQIQHPAGEWATAVIRRNGKAEGRTAIRIRLHKNPARLATLAITNQTARIAWAVLSCEADHKAPAPGWATVGVGEHRAA